MINAETEYRIFLLINFYRISIITARIISRVMKI